MRETVRPGLTERHPLLANAPWQVLGVSDLHRCQDYARRMRLHHHGQPNARPLRNDGLEDVVGKLGELVYGRTIGQEPQWFLNPTGGDGGEDFPGVNVRARGVSSDALYPPQLLVPPEDLENHPRTRAFVLVAIDVDSLRGAPLGWATRAEMLQAPIREDIKHPAHAMKATWLRRLPVVLP